MAKFWTHYVNYGTRVVIGFRKDRKFDGTVLETPIKERIRFRKGLYETQDEQITKALMDHPSGPRHRKDFILLPDDMQIKNKDEMNEKGNVLRLKREKLENEAKRYGIGSERIKLTVPELEKKVKQAKIELLREAELETVDAVDAIPSVKNVIKRKKRVSSKK